MRVSRSSTLVDRPIFYDKIHAWKVAKARKQLAKRRLGTISREFYMSKNKEGRHIVIGVMSHKDIDLPNNEIYVPIEVGSSQRNKHFFANRDDQGINISEKNESYCELTGIYYVYKNIDADILGFVHYRRFFVKSKLKSKKNRENILTGAEIDKKLSKYDFVLPKKRHYYIETNYSHYCHAHKKEALDKTGEILKRFYPEYYTNFVKHMKRTTGHYFNMFIAKKENVCGYLDWVFAVLFELEKNINLAEYNGYDKRVFGFISELLLDVYIATNHLTYTDQNYKFMEEQHWPTKVMHFINRKLDKNHDTTEQ